LRRRRRGSESFGSSGWWKIDFGACGGSAVAASSLAALENTAKIAQ